MDLSNLGLKQHNPLLKKINDLDELITINDKINDKYSFMMDLDSTSNDPILYINGSILDNEINHEALIKKYNKIKDQYKNEWIIDVSNININIDTIAHNYIPCARLIFSTNKKIIELLTFFACNPPTIAKEISDKYKCKVYTFLPNDSILIRTAKIELNKYE